MLTVLYKIIDGNAANRVVQCSMCGSVKRERSERVKLNSCSCTWSRQFVKHGHARGGKSETWSRTYRAWASMIRRCTMPGQSNFKWYGGRGISVCDRWHDFRNFLADMGECPDGLTIERQDNEGHYEPGNCVWATASRQARNTRRTRWVEAGGRRLCLEDWIELIGVSRSAIYNRAARRGVPVDEIIRDLIPAGG